MKAKLQLAALVAAMAGVIVGLHYEIPAVIAATSLGIGLFVVVSGLGMIVTRRGTVPVGDHDGSSAPREHHTGVTAQLWGFLYVLMGAGFALFGVHAIFPATTEAVANRLMAAPLARDVAIAGAGALFCVYGLTRLLAPAEAFREVYRRRWERTLSGCYTCTIGVTLVTLAALLHFAPWVLTALERAVIALVTDLAPR